MKFKLNKRKLKFHFSLIPIYFLIGVLLEKIYQISNDVGHFNFVLIFLFVFWLVWGIVSFFKFLDRGGKA